MILVGVVVSTDPLTAVLASVVEPCNAVQDAFQESHLALRPGSPPRGHLEWGCG